MKIVTATVEKKIGEDTFSRTFEKPVYETPEDILEALQDPKKAATVLEYLNYGTDLKLRAPVAQAILQNEAAQAQAIKVQVKAFMESRAKSGKPVTEAQARKFVEMSQTMDLN